MTETRKERRKRERAERKLIAKNLAKERAKESRINVWFKLILVAIGFSVAAVFGYRPLYAPSVSKKFEGTFVRLESSTGRRSHITSFVYVDDQSANS